MSRNKFDIEAVKVGENTEAAGIAGSVKDIELFTVKRTWLEMSHPRAMKIPPNPLFQKGGTGFVAFLERAALDKPPPFLKGD